MRGNGIGIVCFDSEIRVGIRGYVFLGNYVLINIV
jgi:hypothetical protein